MFVVFLCLVLVFNAVLSILSSFVTISLRKRELVCVLTVVDCYSSDCSSSQFRGLVCGCEYFLLILICFCLFVFALLLLLLSV